MLALMLAAFCAASGAASGASAATQAVAPFACVGAICGFNVLARELRVAPCRGQSMLVAYSMTSGLSLVQCSAPGDVGGNASFLFDRANPARPGLALNGTRFVKPDALAEVNRDGVPDRFGPVPLCAEAGSAAAGNAQAGDAQAGDAKASAADADSAERSTAEGNDTAAKSAAPKNAAPGFDELLLLQKRPGPGAARSACYALLRVRLSASEPVVRGARGEVVSAGAVPAANVRWQTLVSGLLPWLPAVASASVPLAPSAAPWLSAAVPASASASASVTMQVSQVRARLFEQADPASAQRGYLVKGDRVQVLDDSRLAEGWLRVRYAGPNGRGVDCWMQASALALVLPQTATPARP